MMPQFTETLEHAPRRHCSIEQTRQLLESLRTAYQSLSLAERSVIQSMIRQAQREQLMQDIDEERECFESAS